MTTAAELLHQARTGAALSQAALAANARIPQASIARAERGAQDLTVGTLERLVRSAGYQLIVIPTRLATAASTADAVKRFIAQGSTDGPFRAVIQLADDLAHSAGALRSALAITPPAPSGDTRYDAFIAGVVETRLSEQGLALPTWVNEAPRLSEPWFVDEWSAEERAQSTINATPPPLRKRGVILDASELVSV